MTLKDILKTPAPSSAVVFRTTVQLSFAMAGCYSTDVLSWQVSPGWRGDVVQGSIRRGIIVPLQVSNKVQIIVDKNHYYP